MEDGANIGLLSDNLPDHMKNGVVGPIMANFPEGTVATTKDDNISKEYVKVNGESNTHSNETNSINCFDNSYSSDSESDALVIDERATRKRKTKSKVQKKLKDTSINIKINEDILDSFEGSDKLNLNEEKQDVDAEVNNVILKVFDEGNKVAETKDFHENKSLTGVGEATFGPDEISDINFHKDVIPHSNPYFSESLFDLSQQHHKTVKSPLISCYDSLISQSDENPKPLKPIKQTKCKPKPQLKEYAQYLGLQPTVQFKCSKCGKAGFETLSILQEHLIKCNEVQNIHSRSLDNDNSCSSFKLTRKVFLCSACGTYYENWNLYMHMLEFHRRYICLYCLGMFSILEDLYQHIQSRHNLEPGRKNSLDEFFNVYNEPCYLVCCECNKLFSEQDNFFYHNCVKSSGKNKPKQLKQMIRPENHVTGESMDFEESQSKDMEKERECNLEKNTDDDNKTDVQENSQLNNQVKAESEKVKPFLLATETIEQTSATHVAYSNDNSNHSNIDNEDDKSKSQGDSSAEQAISEKSDNELMQSSIPFNTEAEKMPVASPKIPDSNEKMSPEHCQENNLSNSDSSTTEKSIGDEDKVTEGKDVSFEEREEEQVETRRVPKLSLKLPKLGSFQINPEVEAEDSDESDKVAMEVDHIESENEVNQVEQEQADQRNEEHNGIQIAEPDISITELELDQPLDRIDVRLLLQKCLLATAPNCIYCNHSRKIAVNAKQLGLHAIAEHRYSAIVNSITAEELIPESFIARIKESLNELDTVFLNLESSATEEGVTFSHVFECFQCYYSTTVHKELYLHNRKFHSKNLLLCIMCKSNFYSYSELICHLCPGLYIIDYELQFRCCMCVSDDLPSSFRLMVHLRKRHNVCDVCLEMCHSQYKLSNHVWKHKLHHFCYRCGIAYRNKPDITRHLFWKHGTESVLCKRCLQKKWPHVYHFCIPPANFTCEECNSIFSRAVSLKVHKRLHTDEKKHSCTFEECTEKFVSKKLLSKHEQRHREPPPDEEEEVAPEEVKEEETVQDQEVQEEDKKEEVKQDEDDIKPPPKPKVDVYNLPELNLSESDSSDSETEADGKSTKTEEDRVMDEGDIGDEAVDVASKDGSNEPLKLDVVEEEEKQFLEEHSETKTDTIVPSESINESLLTVVEHEMDTVNSSAMIQNIWDNFKNYQASKEKLDHMFTPDTDKPTGENTVSDDIVTQVALEENKVELPEELTWEKALKDHDYCLDSEIKQDTTMIETKPDLTMTERVDHDYCFHVNENEKDSRDELTKDNDLSLAHQRKEGGVLPAKPPLEEAENAKVKGSTEKLDTKKKKRSASSSSSSSGSDSSSCSCGSNCSCSSSSGSSSSSSDSSESDSSTEEGRRKQQTRRQKRRQKKTTKSERKKNTSKIDVGKPIDVVDVVTAETKDNTVKQPMPKPEMPIRESDLETTESETDEEFYDRTPLKLAKKVLEEKRAQLLAEMGPNSVPNGSFIESTSRPPTPPAGTMVEEVEPKRHVTRKKKTKKRKKRKTEKKQALREYRSTLFDVPIPPYYQQFHSIPPTVAPITLSISRNSPIPSATVAPSSPAMQQHTEVALEKHTDSMSSTDSNLRASKRRRVPNKFYGYSSDEEHDKATGHASKVRKIETAPTPRSPMVVPPITIKPLPPRPATPTVEPISIRLPKTHPGDFRVQPRKEFVPPVRVVPPRPPAHIEADSNTESNESEAEEPPAVLAPVYRPNQPQLYCYCRCPYDEVSEMIGCDSSDCAIEWFHFECVGIMVPPKGQWFCPDCRKRKQQQRRESLQT